MFPGYEFSLVGFLAYVGLFVVVPSSIAGGLVWLYERDQARARGGPAPRVRGLPALAVWALAFLAGLASFGAWLTWSAGPGRDYAVWQVVACGATTLLLWWLCARLGRPGLSGVMASSIGIPGGFTTGFAVLAVGDETGQAGVGVLLISVSLGTLFAVLGLILCRYAVRIDEIRRCRLTELGHLSRACQSSHETVLTSGRPRSTAFRYRTTIGCPFPRAGRGCHSRRSAAVLIATRKGPSSLRVSESNSSNGRIDSWPGLTRRIQADHASWTSDAFVCTPLARRSTSLHSGCHELRRSGASEVTPHALTRSVTAIRLFPVRSEPSEGSRTADQQPHRGPAFSHCENRRTRISTIASTASAGHIMHCIGS